MAYLKTLSLVETVSDGAMVSDVCRGKDVEGDGRGLMCCNIPAFVLKD